MIKLYTADIREIKKADYISEYNLLCSFQQQKIDNLKLKDDKKRSLAVRILLRKGIKELFGREDYILSYSENGKPTLDFCKFSLSHSGNMAVCTFAETDIGVDIEELRERKFSKPFRFFTKAENEYILSALDKTTAFFEIWTKKEAYIKMMGAKLSHNAQTDIFDIKDVHFETKIENGYMITVCVNSNQE